jgi:asparagine synthase (glutamine-hydrolysing)
MCGIAGWMDGSGSCPRHTLRDVAERMTATLRHRGPDDGGVWTDPAAGVALGHRRLSIVDLSPSGAQPMVSPCARYVIVFNGEIYNFQQVRAELISRGRRFRGSSDTEVILAAVSEWGVVDSLQRFNGMFAFALWDSVDRVLHLARDRAGEKPLYYGWIGRSFVFASELKALRAHPDFRGSVDRAALSLYVQRACVPAPHSIYEGIYKLPPACHMVVPSGADAGSLSPVPYWSAREAAEAGVAAPFAGDSFEAIEELGSLLRDAVRLRMIADVPLGAFLSGGVDSSTIVAMMQVEDSRPVKTFTIGFRESLYDEAGSARRVARHLGTEHTELYLGPQQTLGVISRLPSLYDEPFADSSQIPTFLISELARRHVTVSLTGDAGDELFGGYNLYRAGRLIWTTFGWMPSALRRAIGVGLRSVPAPLLDLSFAWLSPLQAQLGRSSSIGDKLHKLAPVLIGAEPELMRRVLVANWRDDQALVLDTATAAAPFADQERSAAVGDFVQHMMFADLVSYLPDDILVKVDRASMGVSLETRVPFLDHRLIEFAWRLPHRLKLRGGSTKWILRQLLYRYVPRALVDRPKSGFAVPLSLWLRGPLREFGEDLLNESRLRQEGWFDAGLVRSLWNEHISGRRNWEQPLWSVLMFEAWLQEAGTPRPAHRTESALAPA